MGKATSCFHPRRAGSLYFYRQIKKTEKYNSNKGLSITEYVDIKALFSNI